MLGGTRLGEADRLVTLYTQRRGKVRAVVRGALRPRSRLGGHIQPLSHCQLMLTESKGLDVVTGCQIIGPLFPMREDLVHQARGFYLMELIDCFCPEGLENSALFFLLVDTLEHLCLGEGGERVLRRFEVRLLDITGFRPELHCCLGCQQALEPVTNYLSPSAGGLLCRACAPEQSPVHSVSVNTVKVLRLLREADMETVNRLNLAPDLAAELEAALRSYIQYVLERSIKSGVWLERLRREFGPNGALGGPQNGR